MHNLKRIFSLVVMLSGILSTVGVRSTASRSRIVRGMMRMTSTSMTDRREVSGPPALVLSGLVSASLSSAFGEEVGKTANNNISSKAELEITNVMQLFH